MGTLTVWLFCYAAPGWSVLMGVIALVTGMPTLREALASRRWRQAAGIIRTSQVAPERASTADTMIGLALHVPLQYEYEVGGRQYSGSRLFVTNFNTTNKRIMESLLAPYPVGAQVVVYYNPVDPARSALRPGLGWPGWLGLGGCCLLIFFGVLWALVAAKVRSQFQS